MPFAPVSDRFHSHPKVVKLGQNLAPIGLWLVALTYTTGQLLDGAVPSWFPKKVAGRRGKGWAAALVRVGLWDVTDDGWVFHDFHDWQKSGDEIKHIRHMRRQAGHLGGLAKALAHAKQDARPNPKQDATGLLDASLANFETCYTQRVPTPTPTPTPTSRSGEILGEREKILPLGGKTIQRGGSRLTDAGAPPTGTEGRPPRLVTPNVAGLFLSLQASETSEEEQQTKAAKLAEYQAYLARNGLTPGQETC
jgi:hypothetical protein